MSDCFLVQSGSDKLQERRQCESIPASLERRALWQLAMCRQVAAAAVSAVVRLVPATTVAPAAAVTWLTLLPQPAMLEKRRHSRRRRGAEPEATAVAEEGEHGLLSSRRELLAQLGEEMVEAACAAAPGAAAPAMELRNPSKRARTAVQPYHAAQAALLQGMATR